MWVVGTHSGVVCVFCQFIFVLCYPPSFLCCYSLVTLIFGTFVTPRVSSAVKLQLNKQTNCISVSLVRKLLLLVPESEREDMLRRKGVNHLSELSLEQEVVSTRRGFTDKVSIPDSDLSKSE